MQASFEKMQLQSEPIESDATSVDSHPSRSIKSDMIELEPHVQHENYTERALTQRQHLTHQTQLLRAQENRNQQNYAPSSARELLSAIGYYPKFHEIGSYPGDALPNPYQQGLASASAAPLPSREHRRKVPQVNPQHRYVHPNMVSASIASVPPSKILQTQLDIPDSPVPDLDAPKIITLPSKAQTNKKIRPSMLTDNGSPKNRKKDFKDLPTIRQKSREARLRAIKQHWGRPVRDCIPQNIRPRKQESAWRKAHKGDEAAIENDPRNWSDHLLNELSALSRVTKNELGYAQGLMLDQVSRRLADAEGRRGRHKAVVELLLSDLKRATAIAHERGKYASGAIHTTDVVPPIEDAKSEQQSMKNGITSVVSGNISTGQEEVTSERVSTVIDLRSNNNEEDIQFLSDDDGYQASTDSRSPSPLATRSAPLQGTMQNPQQQQPFGNPADSADVNSAPTTDALTGSPHIQHYSKQAYNAYIQMLHYQNMVAEGRARAFREQELVYELQAQANIARAQAAEARVRALFEEANANHAKCEIQKMAFNRTKINESGDN